MITEFSFTVTMVTGDRKEVELLQSSARPAKPLTETKMSDYSPDTILYVCVCVVCSNTQLSNPLQDKSFLALPD